MIRRKINIDNKWKVIVYYNIDYNLFDVIIKDLRAINISNNTIYSVYNTLHSSQAKAVTISNDHFKTSIVLFNKHKTKEDYINSIVHEAEHIKQAVLDYYNIDDFGELPAYTIGYIAMKLLDKINIL